MFKSLTDWYIARLQSGGYPLVALLMAMESSVLPLPSEVVIPPAAHLAHSTGKFSIAGIIIAGTIGSWIGATVMYWLARWGGRPLLERYGSYARITPEKIEGAEPHFDLVRRFDARAWGDVLFLCPSPHETGRQEPIIPACHIAPAIWAAWAVFATELGRRLRQPKLPRRGKSSTTERSLIAWL